MHACPCVEIDHAVDLVGGKILIGPELAEARGVDKIAHIGRGFCETLRKRGCGRAIQKVERDTDRGNGKLFCNGFEPIHAPGNEPDRVKPRQGSELLCKFTADAAGRAGHDGDSFVHFDTSVLRRSCATGV